MITKIDPAVNYQLFTQYPALGYMHAHTHIHTYMKELDTCMSSNIARLHMYVNKATIGWI